MKPLKVALLTALGMTLTSASVIALTNHPAEAIVTPDVGGVTEATDLAVAANELGHFETGTTLRVEGRVSQPKIAASGDGSEIVMVDVHGTADAKGSAPPAKLAIAIDRSGSMKGTRIKNAIDAAIGAVERLREGDIVTVLAFDTQVKDVVSPTEVSSSSRASIESAIRGIQLGGDTCISCGIERAMTLLGDADGKVGRIIVLSDGDANNGVRDVPGFRAMAQRSMQKGLAITTIGVDVDYNEKIMAAIAEESNGRHYFVANDSALPAVFEAEADALNATIASDVEVTIDLAPGVELDRVFDRSFRRNGSSVVVSLGSVGRGEEKTVVMKVRAPKNDLGERPLASVGLAFKDRVTNIDGRCDGKLAIEVTKDQSSAVDPVVLGRVERTETGAALREANRLFEQGHVVEANRRLATQRDSLVRAKAEAGTMATLPSAKARDVDKDFDGQIATLGNANKGFATPPANAAPNAAPPAPPQQTRDGKSQVKSNAQQAVELAF